MKNFDASSCKNCAWLPLDNAGHLYAGAHLKNWSRTFRVAAVLDEDVKPDLLQQALDDLSQRAPSYFVRLRDGLFWSYLERTDEHAVVKEEDNLPYRPIPLTGNMQPNFRVLYCKKRVALEIFHAVCDGSAAFHFLVSLLTRYYELQGVTISDFTNALSCADTPTAEECGDAYRKHSDAEVPLRNPKKPDTYFRPEPTIPRYANVIHGVMRVEDVRRAAANYEVTVTEYLAAVLMFCYLNPADEPVTSPLRVSIPIDLRRHFDSQSTRNFAYMFDVSFDPKGRTDVEFTEICAALAGQVQEKSDPAILRHEISANVKTQANPLLRAVPYPIKKLVLRQNYKKSQLAFTTFLSNYGVLTAPPEVLPHIRRAEFVLGDTPYQPFNVACVSVNDLLTLSVGASHPDRTKQQFIFRFLASEGIDVRVESNFFE